MKDIVTTSIEFIYEFTGGFNLDMIQKEILNRGCNMEKDLIQKRVDEYKKSEYYRSGKKKDKDL